MIRTRLHSERGTARRVVINLVAVIVASSVLTLYALTRLVAGAVFGAGYPLYIALPEAGGLTENKQVTLRGMSVGTVADVDIEGDHVVVEMEIDQDAQIPVGVDVVVLRQSAIGEQALDLRPREATTTATDFYEEGERIEPLNEPVLPTKPEDLLVLADRVFAPIDEENAGRLLAELADVVRGRSADFQSILADSASFSESIGDNGEEYDRFFAASRSVNATLAENRVVLAQVITDLAGSAQLIGDLRGSIDALLDDVPPVLTTTTSLLERGDANLACVLRDLADINTYVAAPPHLEDLAETLRTNTWFFTAFRVIGPRAAADDKPWLRVQLVSHPEPVPQRYVPDRPIPDTLPGGACESVFGPGAGPATQPGHQLVIPEGRVVPPGGSGG